MFHKPIAWAAVALTAMCLAGYVIWRLQQPEDFPVLASIKPGMSLHDVETILGPPRPRHPKMRSIYVEDLYGGGILMYPGRILEWWFDNCVIQIVFDDSDQALFARSLKVYRTRNCPLRFW
jgi:hypothetical protein